ncbi:DMP19 family protein [Tamlana sp. 2201CG12-4]|uniref:DMP19 family protein n=1 Tax=Tamlana sp. 2201CG12-4 TaxID=3112582 RepID=UPI002DB73A58|nr:DMP19 family protein [Tamlana sp. 2201CG12-4]MEC3907835.1 DMP19 family protein [Tamlana sp. 2201CG12-4]
MNYKLIIPILVIVILAFWFYKSKTNKPTGIADEWNQKVNSAKLTKESFNKASIEEKEDLIYYFTQKIRKKGNYGEASFSKMPKTLKTVYLINELESEVNNGGFLQFFTNSSGKHTNETIESLELIGANNTKNLLEKAVEIMLKHNESIKNLNRKINSRELYEIFETSEIYDNEVLMKELNDLDSKFYESTEPTQELKFKYFESNENGIWNELKEKYGS